VETVPGSGRATLSGVTGRLASGALHAAHDHIRNRLSEYQIPAASADRDLHVQVLNPMEAEDPTGLGLGIFLAIVSGLRRQPVPPGMVVIGDLSVQGSILEPDAIGEMILLARENGAQVVFVPVANRDDVKALPAGIQEGLHFEYFAAPSELVTLVLS
jgi:ATP-dependent Lon protease